MINKIEGVTIGIKQTTVDQIEYMALLIKTKDGAKHTLRIERGTFIANPINLSVEVVVTRISKNKYKIEQKEIIAYLDEN